MDFLLKNIKWVMIVSGLITCSMLYAAIAPEQALKATFGESISGPIAEIVVRNWGVLITMVGGLLIYGAFNVKYQVLAVLAAVLSKMVFISLVVTIGQQYLSTAGVAVVFDSIVVAIFVSYLMVLGLYPDKRLQVSAIEWPRTA